MPSPRGHHGGFDEQIAARHSIKVGAAGESLERGSELSVVSEYTRSRSAKAQCNTAGGLAGEHPAANVERTLCIARCEKGPGSSELEFVPFDGVLLEPRGAQPVQRRRRVFTTALEEVGKVSNGAFVVGGFREQLLELGACLVEAAEALLEKGGPSKPNGTHDFSARGLKAETRNTVRQMDRKLFVSSLAGHRGVDGVVGFLVVRAQLEDTKPCPFGRTRLASSRPSVGESLQGVDLRQSYGRVGHPL
jgi:hypothetical protein